MLYPVCFKNCCLSSLLTILLSVSLSAKGQVETSGIQLGMSRVIFNEADNNAGVMLPLQNSDPKPYLVQSIVRDVFMQKDTSFIVTPPLFRIEGGQKGQVQIIKGDTVLVSDRESLYFLCVKGIPSQAKKADMPQKAAPALMVAINSCIKVLYRPVILAELSSESVAADLTWRRQGNQLIVNNPSPFYQHFSRVSFGNLELESAGFVAPFSTAQYTLPPTIQEGVITWSLIDEFGGKGPLHSAQLRR